MKLLFDEMLKSLCSWFRILGVDSAFASGRKDNQILHMAMKEGRVLVTRDLPLTLRCERHGVKFVLVKGDAIDGQIAQVLAGTGLRPAFPGGTHRCASCNGELADAPKDSVAGKVPQNTLEHHERFWRCRTCGKVYWEGGHWSNIMRIYGKARQAAGLSDGAS
jgi:uncharacterized protein with PIN domain